MKKLVLFSIAFIEVLVCINLNSRSCYAQCSGAYIKIDNNLVLADDSPNGIRLPYWLATGQSLAADQNVNSVSVIEFVVNSSTSTLSFSNVLSISTSATVQSGKVWKIESISKKYSNTILSSSSNNSVTLNYGSGGNYTWTAPACVYYICADLWGGGGAGGGYNSAPGGGGGGGAYIHICSAVTPGTAYPITVGAGGAGIINATGSNGGPTSITIGSTYTAGGGTGGSNGGGGGTITGSATIYTNGQAGTNGGTGSVGGTGGSGGNGGKGGMPACNNAFTPSDMAGVTPGGGGGGGSAAYGAGGRGADGRIIISW